MFYPDISKGVISVAGFLLPRTCQKNSCKFSDWLVTGLCYELQCR